MSSILSASPAKLQSGAWGARVRSETVRAGDTIQITTSSGKSWQARVERVLWAGEGVAICATVCLDRAPQTPRYDPSTGRYLSGAGADHCGYPCPVTGRPCTASDPCHDCA